MKFNEYLNESSLSRLRKHMIEHNTGTITAFRSAEDCGMGEKVTKNQNRARNKILLAGIRKNGYFVTKAKGSFIENYGSANEIEVGEEVYFANDLNDKGNLKNKLMELGEKFNQDSILFIPKGGEKGMLIGTNHCPDGYPGYHKVVKLMNPVFGKKGEFMTKMHNRPFVLKQITEEVAPPSTNMGRWGVSILADSNWREISKIMED